jgi:glyoxylase-like metal-dependent hydrolase (beta-lactamase superfamily II)
MMIRRVKNRFFSSNTYLLINDADNTCIIVDPGLDEETIDKEIEANNLLPLAIVCTHGHFDHTGTVSYFKNKYNNIPYYIHEADLKISQSVNFFLKLTKIEKWIDTATPDFLLKGKKENLKIGSFDLDIYNFPGHTEGSCIIKWENNLFSGDIIYKKGLGLDSFPGENKAKLKKSIIELFDFFSLKDMVFPGHGDAEYLGLIKENNSELAAYLN